MLFLALMEAWWKGTKEGGLLGEEEKTLIIALLDV